MNKAYTIDSPFSGSNSFNLSKDYFLPEATSVVVQFTNIGWAYMRIGQWGQDNIIAEGVSNNTFSYELKGNELEAAKNDNVYLQCAPAEDSKLIILNKDANYGVTTTEPGTNPGTDTPGTDNPGTDTPVVTPSTKTLAEKIAAREQLTDVPTIYLTVPDAIGQDINSVLTKENNVAEYHTATIQVVDNGTDKTGRKLEPFTDQVEMKLRGNSTSTQSPKKPYRLKFAKDKIDASGNIISHKHDLLGLGYKKRNWTLIANALDPAMIRNALTYHLGKYIGMPFCPGYKFVDLVINEEYRGTYMVSDHVEVGSNRIDVDDETGWYIESANGNQIEEPKVEAGGLHISVKNPEPKTEAEIAALKAEVSNYFKIVNSYMGVWTTACSDEDFQNVNEGWRQYFDEESLVRFYVGTNLTGDHDGFMQVKMYKNEGEKMHFGPLWDKDYAYGNWDSDDGSTLAEGMKTGSPYFCNYMLKIMTDPLFVKNVRIKLNSLLDNKFTENILKDIDYLTQVVAQTQVLNHQRWPVGDFSAAIKKLKDYMSTKGENLTEIFDSVYEELGGDEAVKKQLAIGTEKPGTDGPGGGTPGTTDPAFEMEVPASITFGSWDYKPISASLFNKKATSATISVKGAVFVCISKTNGESGAIVKFAWNDANKSGVTYELEGENLELAKKGMLFIGCNDDKNIKMTVTNHGVDDGDDNNPGVNTPTIRAQLTNLPTIYLDAETIDSNWKQAAIEVFDKDNKLNQGVTWKKEGLTADGDPAIGVQFQGSGSMTSGKKESFRLKFGKKTALLTNDKYKQWVLMSNDDDPSMINNALAKELGDAVGMPWTPGYQFVDLYVNNTYMGTYQVSDRVKAEPGRALVSGGNKDFDWHVQFDDNGEIKENDNSTYIAATETTPNIVIKNPDADDITVEQLATLKADMQDYFLNTFFVDIKNNVDREQLINWYICQEILCSYKGLSSIEVYRSITSTAADNKVHFGPLWDSEKAFGNAPKHPIDMSDKNTEGSHDGLITKYADYKVMKKILKALWKETWFKEGVIAKWKTLYGTEKTTDLLATLKSKAAEISGTLTESQAKNAALWPTSLDYGTTDKYSSYADAVKHVTDYLDERFEYLDVKFAELSKYSIIDLIRLIDDLNNEQQDADINDIETIKNKILNN